MQLVFDSVVVVMYELSLLVLPHEFFSPSYSTFSLS